MDQPIDAESYPPWTRIDDEGYLRFIEEETGRGSYDLSPGEKWWTERYHYLETRGYQLRARYKPGWKPWWKGTNIDPDYCPDSHSLWFPQIIDAYRIMDGAAVAIKKVRNGSNEISIHSFLTTPERLQNPRNHCVPLLERLKDCIEQDIELIVMPHLLHFRRLEFYSVGEATDFMQQTLEALVYIHSQDVAHRDYTVNNILLDGAPLHPRGYLPANPFYDRTGLRRAERLRRSDVPSVRYYVIDFGISTRFEDSISPRLVTGTFAQDKDVPELSDTVPYDPFKVDVFTLGNLFKKYFVEKFTNAHFIYPLVERMTQEDPALRPTAEEAHSQFRRIVSRRTGTSLRWRLHKTDENLGTSLRSDLSCVAQEVKVFARYLISRPLVLASLLIIVAGATLSRTLGRDAVFARISQIFSRLRVRR